MENEMKEFERVFLDSLKGTTVPMDTVLGHVAAAKGKRLRPRLVFLSALLFGDINDSTRRTAQFVEMLHTATLIHDDVIDESDIRRGQATVNAVWGNTTAVLSGDYLLTKAMKILSNPVDLEILQDMLSTVMMMVEGEVLQSGKWSVESGNTESKYLEIIERKTARLIRSCCVGGAMSVLSEKTEDRRQKIEGVGEFGLNLGLVFQMRDDILDDDDHENTVIAERLLPQYLDKALKSLDALAPWVKDRDVLTRLRELTVFCAERNH
ncbi:MAG: polyprenyl synthetase family protein [Bacteroidales bacterium]|nr:polyprenyl synthetase family protein [Bacteroidales bacterium]